MARTTPASPGQLARPPSLPWPVFPFKLRWQSRFQQIFPHATAAGIDDGYQFPFSDDPDAYSAAISAWWAEKVAGPTANSPALSGVIR